MPQIGPLEVLLVGVIALLVFGPQRLPEIARSVGRAVAEVRRQASDLREEFSSGLEGDDDDDDVEDEMPAPLGADGGRATEPAKDGSPQDPPPEESRAAPPPA